MVKLVWVVMVVGMVGVPVGVVMIRFGGYGGQDDRHMCPG